MPEREVGLVLIAVGLIVAVLSIIFISNGLVPDRYAGVHVAEEMSYIDPVNFVQASRILPGVLNSVPVPGGWVFKEHGEGVYGNYWRFSLGGDSVARVCISYNTVGMKWSSSSGACPKNHQQYRLGRARMEFWDWWGQRPDRFLRTK